MAATARERDRELRRLDHEREITPDWLHREQAVGYVCYADRFAGTLAGVRERLPYLRELGVTYLHLMPLLAARPEPNDGGYAVADYGGVEPALGTMDDLRALAADLHAHGMALCVDVVLNHTAREHAWAQAALAGDAQARLLPHVPRPHGARRVRADAARGLPRHRARQLLLGARARPLGVDDVQRLPVGPRLHEPRGVPSRWPRSCSGSPPPASTCCASTPCRSCGSARAPTARTSPRSTSCSRRCARSRGSPRPAVAFKAEAIVAPEPARHLPGHGPPRGQGVRPRLQQRADGAALELARLRPRRADDARAGRHAGGAAGRRLGHLRPLPRRHRLGDHAGGRGGRRRGRAPAPPLPVRLLRGRVPGHVRPRRALPARRGDGRGAHERHGRLAGRARGGAAATSSRASSRSGACCCSTPSRSRTAGCR